MMILNSPETAGEIRSLLEQAPEMIRARDVSGMVGFDRHYVYKLTYLGKLPQLVKVGERAVRWNKREIEAWLVANKHCARAIMRPEWESVKEVILADGAEGEAA